MRGFPFGGAGLGMYNHRGPAPDSRGPPPFGGAGYGMYQGTKDTDHHRNHFLKNVSANARAKGGRTGPYMRSRTHTLNSQP